MKKRVADIVIDALADLGVTHAFCVVGGGAMYLDNALSITPRISTVFNHNEQACAMAAEGYARFHSCSKPAMVCVTTGPGGTNTLTGVMGAYVDNIPMVIISGQCRYDTSIPQSGLPLRTRGVQEFDIVSTVKTMTKYSVLVTEPLMIRREVRKAYNIAMSGRKGPVWIDIPLNIQGAVVESDDLAADEQSPAPQAPDITELKRAHDLIASAKRPVILAGSAIRTCNCRDRFERFLESVSIPVVGACVQPDVFFSDHPLYCGACGSVGTRAGNFVLQSADVLLVLGAALNYYETGFAQSGFCPHAHIISVNIDQYDHLKPGLSVKTFIHSDIGQFFRETRDWSIKAPAEWLDFARSAKRHFNTYEGASHCKSGEVDAYDFWESYAQSEPPDSITVLGNNSGVSPRLQAGCKTRTQRTINNVNCGSMGWDLPAAIGVCVAAKRPVTLVTGDGSFMMNVQELATLAHNKLPIRIVIFANDGYGGIRQTCKNYFGGANFGCDAASGISFPNFQKLADAFQIAYRHCGSGADIIDSVNWLFSQSAPALLEVAQMKDNPPIPRVVSKLREDGTTEPAKLHDMYPFLPREIFSKFGRFT